MGLPLATLHFLAREHRRRPFRGDVLTLGRQCVYATPEQAAAVLREEGITPHPLPPGLAPTSNIPAWRGTPQEAFLSDVAFFTWLGVDSVQALDYSAFEGAELVADLNQPVDESLHQRFDLILDSGTLEHVFHIPQALANIGHMLKTGGRVIHVTPANNFTNHGFYQVCPTLYADYYRENGFADLQCFVAEHRAERMEFAPATYYRLDPRKQPCLMLSPQMLQSVCVAEKVAGSTVGRFPLQSYYSQIFQPEQANEQETASKTLLQRIKAILPTGLKHFIRRHVLRRDDHRRPWRLERWAKF